MSIVSINSSITPVNLIIAARDCKDDFAINRGIYLKGQSQFPISRSRITAARSTTLAGLSGRARGERVGGAVCSLAGGADLTFTWTFGIILITAEFSLVVCQTIAGICNAGIKCFAGGFINAGF